jgi:hypothetical protein
MCRYKKYVIIDKDSELDKWITWADITAQRLDPTLACLVNKEE